MTRTTSASVLACVVTLTLGVIGCGSARGGDEPRTLTVLAAASLTDAFAELGRVYEHDRQGSRLVFSFAGSQQVAAQVRHGAPADVVATADTETMGTLARHVERPRIFARNVLAVAVSPGNPEKIHGLPDLARRDVTVVMAAPQVPAGRYARQALSKAGVRVRPASREPSVRAALSRVRMGEADAAVVYATDVEAAGDAVDAVAISADHNVAASYPAAVVSSSQHQSAAQAFVTWLRSDRARAVLARYGFRAP